MLGSPRYQDGSYKSSRMCRAALLFSYGHMSPQWLWQLDVELLYIVYVSLCYSKATSNMLWIFEDRDHLCTTAGKSWTFHDVIGQMRVLHPVNHPLKKPTPPTPSRKTEATLGQGPVACRFRTNSKEKSFGVLPWWAGMPKSPRFFRCSAVCRMILIATIHWFSGKLVLRKRPSISFITRPLLHLSGIAARALQKG